MSKDFIPYARPHLRDEDINAATNVLRSAMISRGNLEAEFEEQLKSVTCAPHAITCNSGSSALYLAYKTLGVTNGSKVWTTPLSFVSTASAALLLGADVSFIDIDEQWNLSLEKLKIRLENEPPPKVLTVVSFAGNAANSEELYALSQEFGFALMMDQSHALGASYQVAERTYPVGNCLHADIEILSFQAVKNVTTGEGGAVLTRHLEIADRIRLLRNNGILKTSQMKPFEYDVVEAGFNMRMTEFQSAIGKSLTQRLNEITVERQNIAQVYDEMLSNIEISLPEGDRAHHAFHIYPILVQNRDYIMASLRTKNIGTQVNYIPIYRHSVFSSNPENHPSKFPSTEYYFERALSIPMFNGLGPTNQKYVIETIAHLIS